MQLTKHIKIDIEYQKLNITYNKYNTINNTCISYK